MQAITKFVEKLTPDLITKYLTSEPKLFHVTCGKGDLFALPFNYCFFESVHRGPDCSSAKVSFFFKSASETAVSVSKWLISSGCPNTVLQDAVDGDVD